MYVIFDMDGVIADSEIVYSDGYMHAAQIYGLPKKDMREAVARATGVTDELERKIMEETFGHLPQFSMEKTYRACRDYFGHIVETGQMKLKPGARSKPDPEIFLKCAARLGVPESKYREVFVIEDSHNGIRAASAAGMRPVMVPDRLPPTQEMREKAAAVLPSLTEVINWLEND